MSWDLNKGAIPYIIIIIIIPMLLENIYEEILTTYIMGMVVYYNAI